MLVVSLINEKKKMKLDTKSDVDIQPVILVAFR